MSCGYVASHAKECRQPGAHIKHLIKRNLTDTLSQVGPAGGGNLVSLHVACGRQPDHKPTVRARVPPNIYTATLRNHHG